MLIELFKTHCKLPDGSVGEVCKNFENQNYIVLGSVILAFVLVAQVVTIILTGWVLISWNKSRKK